MAISCKGKLHNAFHKQSVNYLDIAYKIIKLSNRKTAIGDEGVKADMVVAEAEEKGDGTQQGEPHKEGGPTAGEHSYHQSPLINLTHLKEYLDLPVQVDAKMIHDVLGVSFVVGWFFYSFV